MDNIVEIKYETDKMHVYLPELFRCSDRFSRAKKLIKLSLASDCSFGTNNCVVWNRYISELINDLEERVSKSKSNKQLKNNIEHLKALLEISNTTEPKQHKQLF